MTNDQVIDSGISKARQIIRKRFLDALKATAMDLSAMTDVPVWTHNLWDSVGCGIYENGALIEYHVPPKLAVDPRSGGITASGSRQDPKSATPLWNVPKGVDEDRAYWGQDELFDMLYSPPNEILNCFGFALYYVAAMPYAEVVDRRTNVTHEHNMKPLFLQHIKTLGR